MEYLMILSNNFSLLKFMIALVIILILVVKTTYASSDLFDKVADKYYSEGNTIQEESKEFMGKYDGLFYRSEPHKIFINEACENKYYTIAHELGHYIYYKTKDKWTVEMHSTLAAFYAYYSETIKEKCYNEDETFAELFAWYSTSQVSLTISELVEQAVDILIKE